MQFLEGGDHRRVISLLRLLGSNVLGERAAAADALARIADERGFDWEEVVPSRRAFDEAVAAAAAPAALAPERFATQGATYPDEGVIKRLARDLLDKFGNELAPKERAFLRSMTEWFGPISDRQKKWACDLAERCGAGVWA